MVQFSIIDFRKIRLFVIVIIASSIRFVGIIRHGIVLWYLLVVLKLLAIL